MPTSERDDDYVEDARFVVGAARDLPIVEQAFDAAGARARLFEDPTFVDAKRGHFVYDADNAEARGAYKLPFVDIVEGRMVAVASAVRNAAARLDQTQIPAPVRRRIRTIIAGYLDRAREARERGDAFFERECNRIEPEVTDAGDPPIERGLRRYDRGKIRKRARYDESTGFLRADASVTRAPAVFEYRNRDGTVRREFRSAGHVFSQDNLRRMASATVTLQHPPVRVTSKNVRRFSVGHGDGKIEVVDDHAIVGLIINDDDAIAGLQDGTTRDVSCGYDCDVVLRSGVWTDSLGVPHPYDAEQINHRNNHHALVESGRAGSSRVHLDRTDAMQVTERADDGDAAIAIRSDGRALAALLTRLMEEKGVSLAELASAARISTSTVSQILRAEIDRPPLNRLQGFARALGVSVARLQATLPTEDKMAERQDTNTPRREDFLIPIGGNDNKGRVTIDGVSMELPIEQARAVADQQLKAAADLKTATDRGDALEAERDKAKTDLDKAAKEAKTDEEIRAMVNDQRDLLDRAALFITDAKAFEAIKSKTATEIKRACVLASNPDVKLDGKSDVYIEAMFDLLQPTKKKDAMDEQGRKVLGAQSTERTDRDDLTKRIEKAMSDDENSHRRAIVGGMTADGKTGSRNDALHG